MSLEIERKILSINGRLVHVRFCGEGPPLLILHQSPRSSEEMEGLMQAWGSNFCCIAPDHPGYGYSDPLDKDAPDIHDFAAATAELIDFLGIHRLPVYGHHTGAKIGLSLGCNYPEKVSALVLNGLLVNTQADRDAFLRDYLPPFEPSHDATHLFKLWWRMREQSLFFPWYNRKAGARMVFGIRDAEAIHKSAMDFLSAEDDYRKGYGAALAMDCRHYVDQLTIPTVITAVKDDPLWVDVGRLESAGTVTIARFDEMEPLLENSYDALKKGAVDSDFDPAGIEQAGQRQIDQGNSVYLSNADAQLLVLPDVASEVAAEKKVLDGLGMPFLALDPAGHGPSSTHAKWQVPQGADHIVTFGLGLSHVPDPAMAKRLTAIDLLLPTEDLDAYLSAYVPELSPVHSGAHLAEAYLKARSSVVFWPWFDAAHANAVPGEHLLDADHLHVTSRAILRGWRAGREALNCLPDALRQLHSGATIALPDWAETRSDIRKDFGEARVVYYDLNRRAAALRDIIGG